MNNLISILVNFFQINIESLESSYNWPVPIEYKDINLRNYDNNLKFKSEIKCKLEKFLSENNNFELFKLASLIVKDWGGIRGNKESTLKKYLDRILKNNEYFPFQGVASYSKIYAFLNPDIYAIYDARVASCLNAIQVNAGISDGVYFNTPSGRNNITGNVKTKKGFTFDSRYKKESLKKVGWVTLKHDETYDIYLDTLRKCAKELNNVSIAKIEMLLFSLAEQECKKSLEKC